jgi:hypothetical protein
MDPASMEKLHASCNQSGRGRAVAKVFAVGTS